MNRQILDKIKSRGHWKVIIRPESFQDNLIEPIAKCKEIIREVRVSLRGWEYPYYGFNNEPKVGTDFIEHTVDWSYFKELWRYHQSGLFVHYFGMFEEWYDEYESTKKVKSQQVPENILYILPTIYTITEIYEFASRLANKKLLHNNCYVSINLYKTKDRKLEIGDRRRHLFSDYISSLPEIERGEIMYNCEELISNSAEIALNETIWFFQRFNWDNPPRSVLKGDQQKLLKGLI